MGIFDFLKPNNSSNEKINKVNYDDIIDKKGIVYLNGEKYTGVVQYLGDTTSEYIEGVNINKKHFFKDGSIKSLSEIVNGELIEIQGWIKIDRDGNYDENGRKVLVREYKNGRKIEYYNNGNIKSEFDVNRKKLPTDEDNTFTEIRYFENGNIQNKEVKTKYDETGNNGGVTVEYNSFYENGELLKEKVEDEKYPTKYIYYHRNGTIKTICVSNTQYEHQGHTFEFDENGIEITVRTQEELKEEKSVRKYLGLEKFNGELKNKPKERKVLSHEIMTKGGYSFESKNGKFIEVFGQRHTLICLTEVLDEETEEWEEGERDEIDEFHLTDYEKGYKYEESDLYEFFEIEEEEYLEWDYNGFSNDWCGIVDEDDYDTRLKKWDIYKDKFPNVSSKSQFQIT